MTFLFRLGGPRGQGEDCLQAACLALPPIPNTEEGLLRLIGDAYGAETDRELGILADAVVPDI